MLNQHNTFFTRETTHTKNIITWLPGPAIKSPPPDLLKHNLALSWSRVLHMIKFTLFTTQANQLHYSRIRSFKIPTILLPITTSLHNKHPLTLFSPNFVSYFHIKKLIKTKFIR